jgi:ABC-type spermidine/putrescine transport system permease subunit II
VAQGEFVTILGPSGSGKTTLIVASFIAGRYNNVPKKMFNELILEVNPTITAVAALLTGLTILALAAVTLILARAGKLKQAIV